MPRVKNRSILNAETVTLRCPCGKRLALLFPNRNRVGLSTDGFWYARCDGGQPIHGDDWWRVVCPQCGADHRGRESTLWMLVASAEKGGTVTLGAPPRPAPTSRVW